MKSVIVTLHHKIDSKCQNSGVGDILNFYNETLPRLLVGVSQCRKAENVGNVLNIIFYQDCFLLSNKAMEFRGNPDKASNFS